MRRPRLLHPIPVFLRKAQRTLTAIYDENLREPVGQVQRQQVPIQLSAQIGKPRVMPMSADGGVIEHADGYLLFRTYDLREADTSVERGDQVVQIGVSPNDRIVDYFITKIEYLGHNQNYGGPTLLKAFYEDRQPSQQKES